MSMGFVMWTMWDSGKNIQTYMQQAYTVDTGVFYYFLCASQVTLSVRSQQIKSEKEETLKTCFLCL